MPIQSPYSRFRGTSLTLNDLLSIDRTILANERSLLAYGRTALALTAMGGSCFAFFESPLILALGVVLMAAGCAVMARGWWRYRRMQAMLAAALQQLTGTPDHPLKESVDAADETDDG